MRNLKRALSLLLSSTMVLGMVVMGGSAAGYQDVDASNNNQEAIEVLQAVGIMSGVDDKGNFDPNGSITRNEMAVVMAHLLNLDYDYYRGVNTFSDVPEWAAPYVAACVAEGVTAGVGNGLYGGDQKITAAQAGLMVMKALGYFQNQEDFGGDWQVATIRQASYINLFDKVNSNAESALTRGQVAQLVLNGLKSDMVTFTGDKGIQIGNVTVGYKAEYTPMTSSDKKYNSLVGGTTDIAEKNQYYIQLGEELYEGKLTMTPDTDEFGRPATTWEYDKKDIGTYVDYDLMVEEYTDSVTARDLYDLLGKSVVEDYNITVYADGVKQPIAVANEIVKNNKTDFSVSGKGALLQVFVNKEAKDVVVTVVNTYLAIATADYNEKAETATFDIYGAKKVSGEYVRVVKGNASEDKVSNVKVDNDDVTVNGIKKDDVVLVTLAQGAVQSVEAAKVVSDVTITSFTKNSKIVADGTTYNYAVTTDYNYEVLDEYDQNNMKEKTYNVYLDPYGNLIGLEYVTAADNYVFITGFDKNSSNLANKTWSANAIFLDGTSKVIEVKNDGTLTTAGNGEATLNTWFKYTESNSVYTLTAITDNWTSSDKVAQGKVDDGSTVEIDYQHPSLNVTMGSKNTSKPYVYGNNDSVYLTADLGKVDDNVIIKGASSVSTGIKNTSIVTYKDDADKTAANATGTELPEAAYVLFKSNGYIIGAVVVGEDAAVSKNLVYVNSSGPNLESYNSADDQWTWTREVIHNGEKIELTEVGSDLTYLNSMTQYAWYVVSYNAAGNVTNTKLINTDDVNIKYVNNYASGAIQTAINTGIETVLYEQNFTNATTLPKLIEQTLYMDSSDRNGFFIDESANVVLIQKNDGKVTTTYEVGPAAIEAAIDNLNVAADGKYDYELTAVIERGAAKVVIINDTTNGNKGAGDKEEIGTEGIMSVDITTDRTDVTVEWYDAGAAKTAADFLNKALVAIENKIVASNYTMISKDIDNSGKYVFKAKNNVTGFEETFTFAGTSKMTEVFKLTTVIGGESKVSYVSGNQTIATSAVASLSNKGTGFAKTVGTTTTYGAAYDGTVNVNADMTFTAGYVTVAAATTNAGSGVKNVTVAVTTDKTCAKVGDTVTYTVKLSGTANDDATITLSAGKWASTIPTLTGVTRTSDTVISVANTTNTGSVGTEYTVTATLTVGGSNVGATTVNVT